MANSADPATLFAKAEYIRVQLHCLSGATLFAKAEYIRVQQNKG